MDGLKKLEKFAFVIHPLSAKRDIARKYPFVKLLPEPVVEWALRHKAPMEVSHVTGVESITGAEAEGWFVGCPLTPKLLLSLPIEEVWKKIIETVKIAEDHGAKIVGLGAFTSVVGDGGMTVAKNSNIAVTTGNSYTVATAIEGSIKAAEHDGDRPGERARRGGRRDRLHRQDLRAHLRRQADAVTLVGRSTDRLKSSPTICRKREGRRLRPQPMSSRGSRTRT